MAYPINRTIWSGTTASARRACADADPPGRDRPPTRHARRPTRADAEREQWGWQVTKLRAFRGTGTLTALGLIAEIGDFARFSHPRELASWLGITPSEYSSGE